MREHPIIFSPPMVKAILQGTKTRTRRIIKTPPCEVFEHGGTVSVTRPRKFKDEDARFHPYEPYSVGDILWVREAWGDNGERIFYKADHVPTAKMYGGWKPSIHLKRKDARIFLEVVSVRVGRLQDIGEKDAEAEGVGKAFLDEWVSENDKYIDDAYWIYWDDEQRYWCEKHIDKAVKTFRKEVREKSRDVGLLPDEINEISYMDGGTGGEEYPISCDTCGKPLRFSFTHLPDDLDELIEGRMSKYEAGLYEALSNDWVKLFERKNIHRLLFSGLWNSINEERGYSWESNPWVWVIEFRRVKK